MHLSIWWWVCMIRTRTFTQQCYKHTFPFSGNIHGSEPMGRTFKCVSIGSGQRQASSNHADVHPPKGVTTCQQFLQISGKISQFANNLLILKNYRLPLQKPKRNKCSMNSKIQRNGKTDFGVSCNAVIFRSLASLKDVWSLWQVTLSSHVRFFCSWLYSLVISEGETVNTLGSHSLLRFDHPALLLQSWRLLPPFLPSVHLSFHPSLFPSFLGEKSMLTYTGFGWWLPLFLKQVTKQMACQALALGALWQQGHPTCQELISLLVFKGLRSQ